MSTKTTFKRIALVSAASLGLGLITVVPSAQATISPLTVTGTDGTATTVKADSTTGGSLAVLALKTAAYDSVSVTLVTKTVPTLSSGTVLGGLRLVDTNTDYASAAFRPGATTGIAVKNDTGTASGGFIVSSTDSTTASTKYFGATFKVFFDTLGSAATIVAGTYVFTAVVQVYEGGAVVATKQQNVDVSVVVSAPSAAVSAATSTAYISAGTVFQGTNAADSASITAAATASTTPVAVIRVDLKNASSVQTYANESITATTNIGTLGGGTSTAGGGSVGRTVIFNMTAGSSYYIAVYPDGTAGTASIKVSTPSVTFSTKTVSFYATAVSSITATKRTGVLNVGTSGNSAAISAVVKDSSGNTSNGTVYAYSSDLTVVSDSGTACTFNETNARQECSLTGVAAGTATITLKSTSTGSPAATVISSAAISVTVNNNAIASFKLSTDKTSYAPGEKGYVIITPLDSAGKVVGAGTKTALLATGGVTSSAQLGSSSDTMTAVNVVVAQSETGYVSTDPVGVYAFYAPVNGGDVTLSATGGSGAGAGAGVTVTTKFTVTDNAATALAAVTALASQVSAFITKINAQITTLTDLVMKIQKKVKA